ncbi:PBP1A family penicillin-binding protein [Amylibacter sp.]|nr:PBP1A family penicillin-binding protein [Amylibacter sp.]
MLRLIFSFFGSIFALLTLGCALFAIILTAVFYAYGSDLPDYEQLSNYQPATISRVYSRDGKVIDEFAQQRRLFISEDEIPDIVKNAFISAEDKNFYSHIGYDPAGIAKAIFDAANGKELRGASTITQQVMKNFLLTRSRSIDRKIKEIILATRIEKSMSKEKILELYLNEIFLGQNSYGIVSAADTYFSKALDELTLEEAAYLASLPKAPSNYHPVRQKDRAIARRNFVIREMEENGYVSEDEALIAKSKELITVQGGQLASKRAFRAPRTYFTDEIRRQLSLSFGEEEFFTGGLAVSATMDLKLQSDAAEALRNGLEKYDRKYSPWRGPVDTIEKKHLQENTWRKVLKKKNLPRDINGWHLAIIYDVSKYVAKIKIEGFPENKNQYLDLKNEMTWAQNRVFDNGKRISINSAKDMWSLGDIVFVKSLYDNDTNTIKWTLRQIPKIQGGFVAMDTETGRVLAMQGGFSYQHSVFNRATQAKRQPGSSFKPFVYAAALDVGYSPASLIIDAPIEIDTPQGLWSPKNYSNKFYGPAPLRIGIEQSRNLMTIRLAQDVGMEVISGYAERFGVYNKMQKLLAASLGAQETTLYKMVSSYAMFANGGERVVPTMVDRVQDRFGRTIYKHDKRECTNCKKNILEMGKSPFINSNRERVLDPLTAFRLQSMMRGVVERGTARSVAIDGIEIAGKTGTTNDAKDVWFVGFTRNIVAGCYIGFDTPKPLRKGASGGGMCGPVFKEFMIEAIEKYGSGSFSQPPNTYFAKFDRNTGALLPDGGTGGNPNNIPGSNVTSELFRIGDDPVLDGLVTVIDGGYSVIADDEIFSEFSNDFGSTTGDNWIGHYTDKKKQMDKINFGSLSSGGMY